MAGRPGLCRYLARQCRDLEYDIVEAVETCGSGLGKPCLTRFAHRCYLVGLAPSNLFRDWQSESESGAVRHRLTPGRLRVVFCALHGPSARDSANSEALASEDYL